MLTGEPTQRRAIFEPARIVRESEAWVKDTGQRVVVLFEGRDAADEGLPGSCRLPAGHVRFRPARTVAARVCGRAVFEAKW